jgi:hypothetical protein
MMIELITGRERHGILHEIFGTAKKMRHRALQITIVAIAALAQPAAAQSRFEVVQFKKDTLALVLQCPESGTDHDADITKCLSIEQNLKDRRAAATTKWRWADDLLQRRLWLLEGRITGIYFKRDKRRSPDMCQHAEKAWLSLNRISVKGRVEYDEFFHVRASVGKVVELCRKEIETPEWGAPMALGKPSPNEQSAIN